MRETLTSLLANSLIGAFVVRYMKTQLGLNLHFGGLQYDKDSGYAPFNQF